MMERKMKSSCEAGILWLQWHWNSFSRQNRRRWWKWKARDEKSFRLLKWMQIFHFWLISRFPSLLFLAPRRIIITYQKPAKCFSFQSRRRAIKCRLDEDNEELCDEKFLSSRSQKPRRKREEDETERNELTKRNSIFMAQKRKKSLNGI